MKLIKCVTIRNRFGYPYNTDLVISKDSPDYLGPSVSNLVYASVDIMYELLLYGLQFFLQIATMAMMDNPTFLISHIRNSFITSDNTGMSEHIIERDELFEQQTWMLDRCMSMSYSRLVLVVAVVHPLPPKKTKRNCRLFGWCSSWFQLS